MELKDTIGFMTSADYRERFIAEYWQNKIRYEKLKAFNLKIQVADVNSGKKRGLEEPEHDCPKELLQEQEVCMMQYLDCLEKRAAFERIDLLGFYSDKAEEETNKEKTGDVCISVCDPVNPLAGYPQYYAAMKGEKEK